VLEVPYAGEEHRDAGHFRGGDDFFVANRATGLDHGGNASCRGRFEPIRKWKKRIAREHGAIGPVASLLKGNANALDPIWLAATDPDDCLVSGKHDGVRFDVSNRAPGKLEVTPFVV
jgi:hypothetical protein